MKINLEFDSFEELVTYIAQASEALEEAQNVREATLRAVSELGEETIADLQAEKPKAEKPKAEKPNAEQPKAEKPKADKPKAEKPMPKADLGEIKSLMQDLQKLVGTPAVREIVQRFTSDESGSLAKVPAKVYPSLVHALQTALDEAVA